MTCLPRPVTKMNCSIPASLASSTAYWMTGLSTTGSISLGTALVAGRKRVPMPATGKTALRTGFMADIHFPGMVLKRSVSWHRLAIIVQFQPFAGTMGRAGLIGMFWVMALAGAIAPRPASAMPTMIAQVRAALDHGDAQHAAILAEAALRESGVDANDRGCLLLYRGL